MDSPLISDPPYATTQNAPLSATSTISSLDERKMLNIVGEILESATALAVHHDSDHDHHDHHDHEEDDSDDGAARLHPRYTAHSVSSTSSAPSSFAPAYQSLEVGGDAAAMLSTGFPVLEKAGHHQLAHTRNLRRESELPPSSDPQPGLHESSSMIRGGEEVKNASDGGNGNSVKYPPNFDPNRRRHSGLKKTHIRLANTAVGLREVAKKIGKRTLQWESPPKTLLIVTKIHDPELVGATKELAVWLVNECQMTVLVEERLRDSPEFAAFSDLDEYNIITEYGASPNVVGSHAFGRAGTSSHQLLAGLQKGHAHVPSTPLSPFSGAEANILFWSPEDFQNPLATDPLSSKIDLIVTLGGDGTVLFTAGLFSNVKVPPIVPFDLGSLGFLAVFEFEKAKDTLRRILGIKMPEPNPLLQVLKSSSQEVVASFSQSLASLDMENGTEIIKQQNPEKAGFNVNMRLRLACTIYKINRESGHLLPLPEMYHVLNELVVDRGPSANMSQLELFVDGAYLTTSMADGLVIATPTGSTAYSVEGFFALLMHMSLPSVCVLGFQLSAGGSIVHPLVPALLVTPICPHTLSFRPMLLPESIELKVQVPPDARGAAWVSFDGKSRIELKPGEEVRVEVSRFGVPTVCQQDQSKDWIESLRRCLHWNVRTKQKEYK
ncbi:ATP-NAD kinase-like domain-containing protein [Chytriomyces sp. MP71]|nr:ATP-NAD kinase-like domain-containing protein [Chytriomyces sp. MP71]